jgi:outer membrane protein OmpA-like peptidoglycan-associated protein
MKRSLSILGALALGGILPAAAFSQSIQQGRAIADSDVLSQISMFNYREGPKSDLLFRGTPIAATAQGKGEVEYQDGNARISIKLEDLPEPGSLGPFTTYVLWALTPDGRAASQGVVADFEGGKGKIETLYAAPQFALIVTAEPHFAVTAPSTTIALFNVADRVRGTESKVTTLTERADYTNLASIPIDSRTSPVEIVQARYAIAIAESAGATRYASARLTTATERLAAAETAQRGRSSQRKTVPGLAREAVIAATDARRAAMLGTAAASAEQERAAAAAAATAAANAVAARAAAEAATVAAAAAEAATRAERERVAAAARDDLRNRLNSALPTRETSRGLVSELGGVQFATGRAELNPGARESMARFAGIVASYPSLRFNVEGHTDSVGSPAANNELSLRRAITVRDFLIGLGVRASYVDVAGFGPSMPVADNVTSDGRARNRRVEIVLSGDLFAAP